MPYRICLAAMVAALACPMPADARRFAPPADDLELTFGGAVQPRVSYGHSDRDGEVTDRFGFGLRRARARASARWGISYVEMDIGLAAMSPVQLFAAITPSENWRIRAGYFPGAQPRGMIPTSMTKIDGFERAAIAERWSRANIGGSGRDMGLDVTYANDYVEASLWLHSGFGGLDRATSNFRQGTTDGDATRGTDVTGFAISGGLAFTPQDSLELGGHFTYNPAGGPAAALTPGLDRTITSWSAHVYWGADPGSQFLRLKAEAVGLLISGDPGGPGVNGPDEVDLSQFGAAGTAAVGIIPHGEVFARFEIFDEDDGGDLSQYLTAGLMFSLSAMDGGPFQRERLTLAYANTAIGENIDHLVVLQGQWLF